MGHHCEPMCWMPCSHHIVNGVDDSMVFPECVRWSAGRGALGALRRSACDIEHASRVARRRHTSVGSRTTSAPPADGR